MRPRFWGSWSSIAGVQNLETFEEYLAARKVNSSASIANLANGVAQKGVETTTARSASLGTAEATPSRSRARAQKNWRRAKYAVTRKITQDMLGVQRRWVMSITFLEGCISVGMQQCCMYLRCQQPVLIFLEKIAMAWEHLTKLNHDVWARIVSDLQRPRSSCRRKSQFCILTKPLIVAWAPVYLL